ncbi:type 1 phosphatidylinositol 4,5-bisphosphate 4-phosphatase-like [Tachypleus tridentatus]|uniref:type 1 phosphatidylinositol 4,5-bisphosphate 4-phosphatase-like n=1 Tax=Tachypleus tridentatus TaxID=6853 RepID=UPI003FD15299
MDKNEPDESAPLLQNEHASSAFSYSGVAEDSGATQVTISPIGPDELPPPYTPSPQSGVPMVTCRVCKSMIDISGKKEQHVVKCNNCNEATPIKNAPPGKKYVRCPCNCLLICKATSQRIACPRQNCKKIINLAQSPVTPPSSHVPGMCRIACGHCQRIFLFNTLNNALARCPHCRKVSTAGSEFARRRGFICLLLAMMFLTISLGVTIGTYKVAQKSGGMYVLYIGCFLIFAVFFIRSIYYFTMRVSTVEGTA